MRSKLLVLAAALAVAGCSGGSSSNGGGGSIIAPVTTATPAPVATGVAPVATSSTPSRGLLGDPLSPPRVVGSTMKDALGRQLLLRGANLSEKSKRPPFQGWLTPAHVDHFVRLGFDHVRFLLTWEAIEPRDGVYDTAYLDAVAKELAWFEARGIFVVLDLHQDQFARRFGGDGAPEWALIPDPFPFLPDVIGPFPQNYVNPKVIAQFDALYGDASRRARMARAWKTAAARLKSSPAVIGYDLWNEPFPGIRVPWVFEANELATLERELTAAIRSEDRDRMIFFEPQVLGAAFPTNGVPRPDPNAVYAPHWYDPVVDIRAAQGLQPVYDGDPQRTRGAFANLAAHAKALGCPWWLGEWGIERNRSNAALYVQHHRELLDQALASACYWEVNPVQADVFTPIDPQGNDYPIAAELAHPHPRAVAGTLERTSWDAATRTLEVEWREGGLGPNAPTLVELPAKVFPLAGPLVVTLSDPAGSWRFEREPSTGRLAIWADASQARHTLVVRPR